MFPRDGSKLFKLVGTILTSPNSPDFCQMLVSNSHLYSRDLTLGIISGNLL